MKHKQVQPNEGEDIQYMDVLFCMPVFLSNINSVTGRGEVKK